jgi:hypothetical protein
LRNRDREMEEAEERHQVEIKVYKQKVKHLLYEHQNNITELKADGNFIRYTHIGIQCQLILARSKSVFDRSLIRLQANSETNY